MIQYFENGDLAIFNGKKYRRDKKTGYYLNSATRTRLHRAVWIYRNGEIPKGFHVHHKDEDKRNNEIENLELLQGSFHCSHHSQKYADEHIKEIRARMETLVRPKADVWHGTDEGRAWHSKHAKETCENLPLKKYVCQHCGKDFYKKPLGENKFCSNNCKSAYRRHMGLDNIIKKCEFCGNEYISSKYRKTKYCSQACKNYSRNAAEVSKIGA